MTLLAAVLVLAGPWVYRAWARRRATDRALSACLDGSQGEYPREVWPLP